MAPSLEEPVVTVAPTVAKFTVPVHAQDLAGDNKFGYQPGRTLVTRHDNYAHEDLLPSFPDVQWAPLEYTPYQDKGLRGDPKFRNLLRDATAVFDYNPKIGTEIHGVDLSKLDDAQRDDLARLIAYRGVVFFRSQKNFDIEAQRQLGQYWGKLHKVRYLPLSSFMRDILTRYSTPPHPFLAKQVSRTSMSFTLATTPPTTVPSSHPVSYGTQT